jgi:3-oxoacyl-[acyl-carrier protein] reductase
MAMGPIDHRGGGMRLEGRTVIVTGAAHGIGRAYAEGIAREGANVGLLDIDGPRVREVTDGIVAAGGSAIALEADVRELAADVEAARLTAERFGGIDGLVNNVGLMSVPKPMTRALFEDIPDEEWDDAFRLNTKSVWYMCKAVVPYLRKAGRGSIVNISSSTIFRVPPTRAHYIASKSAVIGLTRVLSRELGGDWIRVNVVCPGSTLSEEAPTPEVTKMREANVGNRSLKRVEMPVDLVGTIVYLLSDDSEFMTGQTLVVEGGSVFN